MKTRHACAPLCLIFAIVLLPGCFHPSPPTPEQLARGYVLLLPGVECTAKSMEGLYSGLRDAGCDYGIEMDQWGCRPFGTFRNLPAYKLNRQRAARIATKVADYRTNHPTAPVTIVGFSGGGAMALFVAEALPQNVMVNRIVLLGAAISPTYDPRPSVARCSLGMVNFYSPGDWFMGGWATETFGTMDRVKTQTAGRCGFRTANGERLTVPGLTQVEWRPEWRAMGHAGGHQGWLARAWAHEVLASAVRHEGVVGSRPAQ